MPKSTRPFVIIGTPDDRRVTLFQEALTRMDLPSASVVAYTDLLENRVDLDAAIPRDAIVRIESPGKNWEVNRAMALYVKRGNTSMTQPFPALDSAGEYIPSWAWYGGFCMCLNQLQSIEQRPDLSWMQTSHDIRMMFDKDKCDRLLSKDALTPSTRQYRRYSFIGHNVFLKSRYGSSGTGIIAMQVSFQRSRERYKIYTSLALSHDVLINTRRLSQFEGEGTFNENQEFFSLYERWLDYEPQTCLIQTWIPKATTTGGSFDLRIVMIAGRMRHIVVRVSDSPITNLHLLNKRGDFDEVRRLISDRLWREIEDTCERVAALFPNSLYMGIDLLISSTWNKHYVLEVNAFGDLLPNLLHEGDDTYTAEIKEILKRG